MPVIPPVLRNEKLQTLYTLRSKQTTPIIFLHPIVSYHITRAKYQESNMRHGTLLT